MRDKQRYVIGIIIEAKTPLQWKSCYYLDRVVNVASFVANWTWGKMEENVKEKFRHLSKEEELDEIVKEFVE